MKKIVVILVLAAVVLALGWAVYRKIAALRQGAGGSRGETTAVAVEVTPVKTVAIRDVGRFTGTLEPRSQFVVAPKIAGRLEKIEVNFGDPVTRNQLIAQLDDAEYAQQVEQARAELEVAKANVAQCRSDLDLAKRELERIQALRTQKIASESELDAAQASSTACEAKHNVALAQVTQKEAELKAAQIRLSYTRILAAWEDGEETRVIGERFVDQGAMLRANDPIVSVLDNHHLTAVIYAIERDYPRLTVGQAATVETDAFPDRQFAALIVRIAPLLKETSRQARVELDIDNTRGLLKPGMFVRVEIEFARHEKAQIVPLAALVKREGKQGVFVADLAAKNAAFVPVRLGITSREEAEVLDPKLAGPVVTLGQHLLHTGSAILVSEPGPAAPASAGATTEPAQPGIPGTKEQTR